MNLVTKKDVNIIIMLIIFSILSTFFGYVVIKYVLEPLYEKLKGGVERSLQYFFYQ